MSVLRTYDCGCKMLSQEFAPEGHMTEPHSIEYCPLHAAAGKLLTALLDLLYYEDTDEAEFAKVQERARLAIKGAEIKQK